MSAAAAAILAACLDGCSSLPGAEAPREYLDPTTAATVSVVGKPLVFYREHPELAVHMRDYVTVAAAAIDRQGRIDYVLIAYFWTTFDAHGRSGQSNDPSRLEQPDPKSAPDKLVLRADARYIYLDRMADSAREVGIGERVHAPPGHEVMPGVYRTDLATLRFLGAARHLDVLRSANDSDSRYPLWDDQRPALTALVRRLSGDP
jgi:hypothetical protein